MVTLSPPLIVSDEQLRRLARRREDDPEARLTLTLPSKFARLIRDGVLLLEPTFSVDADGVPRLYEVSIVPSALTDPPPETDGHDPS